MTSKSRAVLQDGRHVYELLETEADPASFRVLWVAGTALARAIGHILHKVDGRTGELARGIVAREFGSWKSKSEEHAIYWDFICDERNKVLKQYELGFLPGPIQVAVGDDVFELDEGLFCPMPDGRYAGADCRDVLKEALDWWSERLDLIDQAYERER